MAEESSDARKKMPMDAVGNNDEPKDESCAPPPSSRNNVDNSDEEELLVADILLKLGNLMLESLKQVKELHLRNKSKCGSSSQVNEASSSSSSSSSSSKKERQLLLVPPVPSLEGIVKDGKFSKPFEKRLEVNDASNLFLPKREIEDCFLEFLKEEEGGNDGGVLAGNAVPVMVYDKDGKGNSMMLKRRDNRGYRVLNGEGGSGWGSFYESHDLVFADFITVWAFRHAETNMLCFVVISGKDDD